MEYKEPIQVVDPEVTKLKFEEQINKFLDVQDIYRKKGIICTDIDDISAIFLFAVPKLIPHPIAFCVRINFTNFDLEPPSLSFINPFTSELLDRNQIPISFLQINPNNPFQPQDLLQGGNNIIPFFCIPGIKEYHDHPAHSGDSWFLYRNKGEGELLFILDQLYNHSISNSKSFHINVTTPNIRIHQEVRLPNIQIKLK